MAIVRFLFSLFLFEVCKCQTLSPNGRSYICPDSREPFERGREICANKNATLPRFHDFADVTAELEFIIAEACPNLTSEFWTVPFWTDYMKADKSSWYTDGDGNEYSKEKITGMFPATWAKCFEWDSWEYEGLVYIRADRSYCYKSTQRGYMYPLCQMQPVPDQLISTTIGESSQATTQESTSVFEKPITTTLDSNETQTNPTDDSSSGSTSEESITTTPVNISETSPIEGSTSGIETTTSTTTTSTITTVTNSRVTTVTTTTVPAINQATTEYQGNGCSTAEIMYGWLREHPQAVMVVPGTYNVQCDAGLDVKDPGSPLECLVGGSWARGPPYCDSEFHICLICFRQDGGEVDRFCIPEPYQQLYGIDCAMFGGHYKSFAEPEELDPDSTSLENRRTASANRVLTGLQK